MKNLKIFTAFIFLAFTIGTTLKAQNQQCFTMSMTNIEYISHGTKGDMVRVTLAVDNHSGSDVIITDDVPFNLLDVTCSEASCEYTVLYNATLIGSNYVNIECRTVQGCLQEEGCVIVIEPSAQP